MKKLVVLASLLLLSSSLFGQTYQFFAVSDAEKDYVFSVDSLKGAAKMGGLVAKQQHFYYYLSGDRVYFCDSIRNYKAVISKRSQVIKAGDNFFQYVLKAGPAAIRLDSARFSSVNIFAPKWSLRMAKDTFTRLSLEHYNFDPSGDEPLNLSLLKGDELQIMASRITRSAFASNVDIKRIILSEDTLTTDVNFYGFQLPGLLSLLHLHFKDEGLLDLTTFSYASGQRCKLFVRETDFSKLKIDYALFDLDRSYLNTQQLENLYKQLILNQEQAGFKDGYQKADIELRQLENSKNGNYGRLVNFIQLHWNYYGYNKEKIFINALILFALFFAVNLFGYGRLLREAYTIEQIKTAYEELPQKHWLVRIFLYVFYGMFFTGIVFWGLKLDPEKLQLKTNAFLALWILIQYLAGLIVLAYIANIIIGK